MNEDYGKLLLQLAKRVAKVNKCVSLVWSGITESYGFTVLNDSGGGWTVYIPVHDRLTPRQVYLKALKECKKEGLV